MKLLSPTLIALPVVGSTSLFQALAAGSGQIGIFEILFLIGGLWLIGINLFAVDTRALGHFGIFSLTAFGFAGCLVWLVEQYGAAHWGLLSIVGLMLVFAFISYAISLHGFFTRPKKRTAK